MSLQKYEVLLRALECGSLTQAAEELLYTQSGASYMIKTLEEELGFALLVRTRTGVQPTAECEGLLPAIRQLVKWNGVIEESAAAVRGVERGSVSIGCFQSISVHWMPHVIKAFYERHPSIQIKLIEGEIQEMDVWMEERKVDMTFATHQKEWRYDWLPLKKDGMYVILPPDHPLSGLKSFPAQKLGEEPFVMPAQGYDKDIMRVLKELDVTPSIRFTTMDIYGAFAMVECGLGISIMPGLMLRGRESAVAALPISPPQYRQLGVALAVPTLSPAASAFLQSAAATIRAMEEN